MKTLFTYLMMILVLMLSPAALAQPVGTAATATQPSIELMLATTLKLEKTGNLARASTKLAELYKLDADHADVRLAYGRLLTKTGRSDQAIRVLSPLTSQSSQAWRPWFWAGTALLLNQDLANAALYLDEAIARQGDEVAIWVQRAIVEQELDNPQAAIYMLQVADKIQGNNPAVMINFAYANEAIGEIDKAIVAYKQFLKLSTADITYGKLRSLVIVRLSKFALAKQKVKQGAALETSQLN